METRAVSIQGCTLLEHLSAGVSRAFHNHSNLSTSPNQSSFPYCLTSLRRIEIELWQFRNSITCKDVTVKNFSVSPLLTDRKADQTDRDLTSPDLSKELGSIHCECEWNVLKLWGWLQSCMLNTLRTGLLNCLNSRSRGLNFRHRASSI